MTDNERVKAALAALADGASTPETEPEGTADSLSRTATAGYRTVIREAVAATDDLDAAAEFVETVGIDELERAVERAETEVSGLAADGRDALAAFEAFREAVGEDHFHSGRDTSLGGAGIRPDK